MQQSMNKLVVEINDDYHLNILNVELIRSKNRTFQEDFYQFRSRLQYGLDSIDHGDRLKIIVDVDSRIETFIEELASLQIHLMHAGFADSNFEMMVDLFYEYKSDPENIGKYKSVTRPIEKYCHYFSKDSSFAALFFKCAYNVLISPNSNTISFENLTSDTISTSAFANKIEDYFNKVFYYLYSSHLLNLLI